MKTTALRWVPRSLSLALVALFATLMVGQGPPPLWPLTVNTLLFALLITCLAGLLIAWRWQLAGGLFAMVAIAAFYFMDFAKSSFERFPGGWMFALMFITGLLYVVTAIDRDELSAKLKAKGLPSRPQ